MSRAGRVAAGAVALAAVAALGLTTPSRTVAAAAPSAARTAAAAPASGATGGTDPGAPWPTMRHDTRNTGASPLPARDPGGSPWVFATDEGIFSTPAVAADGTVYMGSADRVLYAIDPVTGREKWRFTTGGIIDSAPALLAPEPGVGGSLVVGSGDEKLYRIRTDPGLTERQRVIWSFSPTLPPAAGQQLVNWWEGSPQVGPDGTIYDGNTGGGAYAVNPDGTQRWAHRVTNSVWTVPPLADDGTSYWGSLDATVFALDAAGQQAWQRTTLGFVTSSPALSRDGVVYVGSFDGRLHALDAATGTERWTFATGDHIYSSPALVEGIDGALGLVVVGSTDGSLYALRPDGSLAWAYDTGSPIRSSPAIGRGTDDTASPIAYVGASNGRLYAIDVDTGRLRWSYDTTSRDPYRASRNQLNGSPALGPRGVYIGSQDGSFHYVPYDYCLRPGISDSRCASTGEGPPADVTAVYPVDVGGSTVFSTGPLPLADTGVIIGRLVVRAGGSTVPAAMVPVPDARTLVRITPPMDFDAQVSGDGRYVFVRPAAPLATGTTYRVTVGGLYSVGGARISNVEVGTANLTPFRGTFEVRATAAGARPWPVVDLPLDSVPPRVPALSLSRLAVPLPPMLTSLNQIGFDFYDWVAGVVRAGPDSAVLWVVGASRDAAGRPVADPKAGFSFPLSGRLVGGSFAWSAPPGVALTFTFGPVPLQEFQLRGRFLPGGRIAPDAQYYAQVVCKDVPGYGDRLPLTGMCNAVGLVPSSGTYLGETTLTPAAVAPAGVTAGPVTRDGDTVTAALVLAPGATYPAARHVASILLLDRDGRPLPLDYAAATSTTTDAAGNLTGVSVRVPPSAWPGGSAAGVQAVVMTDVYPLATSALPAG